MEDGNDGTALVVVGRSEDERGDRIVDPTRTEGEVSKERKVEPSQVTDDLGGWGWSDGEISNNGKFMSSL